MSTAQPSTNEVHPSQVGNRILKATGAIFLIQVVLKGFGLFEKSIIGYSFGTTFKTDAYLEAKDIAFNLFQIVDQVIMHSFLPVFVGIMRAKDEKDAWRVASTVMNVLLIFMTTVAVLTIIFAPQVLWVFMHGWFSEDTQQDPQVIALTINLMRGMLVAVIFMGTSSLTYCLLNSYKQFALPASGDILLKGTVLVFAVLFAGVLGPLALVIGFILGAVSKVVVHFWGLGQRVAHYRPVMDLRHPGVRQFFILAWPLLIGVLVSLIRQNYDNYLASTLPQGSLSALKLAKNLCDTPVQFFSFAFGIALFPFLSDIATAGDFKRLRDMLMTATRLMILIFLPLTVTILFLRVPIVIVIFSTNSLKATGPLWVYALWMIIGALEIIVLQFFYSMKETLLPNIIGIAIVPLHIGIAVLAVRGLNWAALGIAAALLFSKGTKVVALYVQLQQRIGSLEWGRTLKLTGLVILALIPLAGVLLFFNWLLPPPIAQEGAGKMEKLIGLFPYVFTGIASLALYGATLAALKVEEFQMLVARIGGKLSRS